MTCALGPGCAQARPCTQAILFAPKVLKIEGLEFVSLYGGSAPPPAGRNPQTMFFFGFVKASVAERRCLQRVEMSHIEDFCFFKLLPPIVVASSGSKSSKNEGLGLLKPLLSGVVASSGSKSSKNEGLGFLKPLLRGVVVSGRSKSSNIEGLRILSLY